jgi:A/G-specific adenine glycosylase
VTANAAERLIQHYVDNFRRLPWRSPPGDPPPDPYRVWLSEIMLQQTTVATVRPRFERFVARWPTIDALAAARDEEILSEWAGLGYYARARNIISCAREVVRRGSFPPTAAELRQLPGIGAYTSAAIAAIAFGEKAAAVDTNVTRVISRLHGLPNATAARIEQHALELIGSNNPADVVQALMDLGAALCRPSKPRCGECPLQSDCVAYASGDPEAFPRRKTKAARPHRSGVAYWIVRDGFVWLVRRPSKGLLGGMAALPGSEWTETTPASVNAIGIVRHVFTHFSLDLAVVPRAEPAGEGWWQPLDRLDESGLPTLYRKAAALVARARSPLEAVATRP